MFIWFFCISLISVFFTPHSRCEARMGLFHQTRVRDLSPDSLLSKLYNTINTNRFTGKTFNKNICRMHVFKI